MTGDIYSDNGIVLCNCDFRDLSPGEIDFFHVDPPWSYANSGCRGNASDQYDGLSFRRIAEDTFNWSYNRAADDAYMILWVTYPHIWEVITTLYEYAKGLDETWEHITGGSWHKLGPNPELPKGLGPGYHTRGDAEPFLLFRKGRPRPTSAPSNAIHALETVHTDRTAHSRKPLEATMRFVEAFCPPGGRVFEPYAGDSGNCALACCRLGRKYWGAEIDESRWRTAVNRLRQGDLLAGRTTESIALPKQREMPF